MNGDLWAFANLYRLHRRRVYSLCFRMLRNLSDAEDLTQEIFIQVFRKLSTLRGDCAFSTWLHRVTVNAVRMRLRKHGIPEVSLDAAPDSDSEQAPTELGTEDRSLIGCIDRTTLASAVDELPPGYRLSFLLHDVYGYRHEEIGEILGCTTGSSKSQLHKTRMRLRRLLAPKWEKQIN